MSVLLKQLLAQLMTAWTARQIPKINKKIDKLTEKVKKYEDKVTQHITDKIGW
jgi:tetrahydromethanopterin S-methyltransferase subunit G